MLLLSAKARRLIDAAVNDLPDSERAEHDWRGHKPTRMFERLRDRQTMAQDQSQQASLLSPWLRLRAKRRGCKGG